VKSVENSLSYSILPSTRLRWRTLYIFTFIYLHFIYTFIYLHFIYTFIYIYFQFVAMDRAVAVRVPDGIAKEDVYHPI